jgi:hypothetical protein
VLIINNYRKAIIICRFSPKPHKGIAKNREEVGGTHGSMVWIKGYVCCTKLLESAPNYILGFEIFNKERISNAD